MVDEINLDHIKSLSDLTKEVLSHLTAREAKILRERFGVDLENIAELEAIGKQFDITRERIRELERKALKKLQKDND